MPQSEGSEAETMLWGEKRPTNEDKWRKNGGLEAKKQTCSASII